MSSGKTEPMYSLLMYLHDIFMHVLVRSDEEYLLTLEHELAYVIEQSHPDTVIFQAGVDLLKNDRLGKTNLTRDGLKERNRLVYKTVCQDLGIPIVVCMGGGYGREIQETIAAHSDVYLQLAEFAYGTHVSQQAGKRT